MISQELIEENKGKLLVEKKKILTILNREDTKDGAGEFPGDFKPKFDELGNEEGDNASEVENFGNQLGVTMSLEERLKKVESALTRIENGTYGQDADGNDIDEARLRAEPAADANVK